MNHSHFMSEARSLALRGLGWTSPNPMVGAIVVKHGKIVGRGWHKKFGGPHAEVFALREAGKHAHGATLYCTLEPCTHTGKTPPCVEAVLAAGISTVVLGSRDSNPIACGGVEILRQAGVHVVENVQEAECRALNAPFFKRMKTGLPFVTLKWAMSADGKIATASGDSKWISGETSRHFAHLLRGAHDAVMIGINTLLADKPKLNCRCSHEQWHVLTGAPADTPLRQPHRVILDTHAHTPLKAPLWKTVSGGPVIILCGEHAPTRQIKALRARGAEVILVKGKPHICIEAALRALAEHGIQSVLVEGGSTVLGSLHDARLADLAYIFVAPLLVGGNTSFPALGGAGSEKIAQAQRLRSPQVQILGEDVMVSGLLSEFGARYFIAEAQKTIDAC